MRALCLILTFFLLVGCDFEMFGGDEKSDSGNSTEITETIEMSFEAPCTITEVDGNNAGVKCQDGEFSVATDLVLQVDDIVRTKFVFNEIDPVASIWRLVSVEILDFWF